MLDKQVDKGFDTIKKLAILAGVLIIVVGIVAVIIVGAVVKNCDSISQKAAQTAGKAAQVYEQAKNETPNTEDSGGSQKD